MVGLQALSQTGVGAGDLGEVLGVGGGLAGDGELAAGGLEVEIRFRHLQHRVVGRGLDPGPVGGDDPRAARGR